MQVRDEPLTAESAFGSVEDITPESVGAREGRRILTLAEVLAIEPPRYLVEETIVQGSLGVLYASPGAGKTFLAIDLACCVASGRMWHGKEVIQGVVLYVAAEGLSGMGPRIDAWCGGSVPADSPLHCYLFVLKGMLDLLADDEPEALLGLIDEMDQRPAFVVLDTLARCHTGDENSTQDMGRIVRACDALRSLGMTILLVHHSGKNSEQERGSSALRGAADCILKLGRNEDDHLVLSNEKQKEGPRAKEMVFWLDPVTLDRLVDGEHPTSCRISLKPFETNQSKDGFASSRKHSDAVLETLRDTFFGDWTAAGKLQLASGVKYATFYRTLAAMVKGNTLERQKAGRAVYYRPKQSVSDESVSSVSISLTETGEPDQSQVSPDSPPLGGGSVRQETGSGGSNDSENQQPKDNNTAANAEPPAAAAKPRPARRKASAAPDAAKLRKRKTSKRKGSKAKRRRKTKAEGSAETDGGAA